MKALQIAQHELRRIFVSPLAWATLGVVQFIIGIVFLLTLHDLANNPRILMDETVGVTEVIGGSIYGFAALLFLLVVPLLTMRMFSEERRSGSIDLYLSAPVSLTELVLGKYLGLLGFLFVMLAVMAIMPLSLLPATPLDFGRLCA
ncbi:MAG: ABC transporter permease, partial [Nevskiales bacterium]